MMPVDLGLQHFLLPLPFAIGELDFAVGLAFLRQAGGEPDFFDAIERHPLGERLVAQIAGRVRG